MTEQKAGTTDLKVYVTADPAVARGPRKFYPAADVEALHAELTAARSLIDASRQQADETIAAFKQDYPLGLQFPYGPLKYERPFLVRSIWHDGAFTYIRTDARELPALYEVKDGAPTLVNFQVRGGDTYVVPKVLDRAYLAIGKAQFAFQQGR